MLQWYKISLGKGNSTWYRQGTTLKDVEDIMTRHYPEISCFMEFKITPAPTHQQWLDEKDYWRSLWQSALTNMPAINKTSSGKNVALAECLGYHYRTKNGNWASINMLHNLRRGTKPSTAWRQQALKKLAGPYGTLFARIQLTKLGLAQQFKYWPK